MKIFARWFLPVTSALDTVVTRRYTAVLNFHVGGGMCELAFGIRSGALVPLKFSADLQLQPARIFTIQQIIHVDHSHLIFCFLENGVSLSLFK